MKNKQIIDGIDITSTSEKLGVSAKKLIRYLEVQDHRCWSCRQVLEGGIAHNTKSTQIIIVCQKCNKMVKKQEVRPKPTRLQKEVLREFYQENQWDTMLENINRKWG